MMLDSNEIVVLDWYKTRPQKKYLIPHIHDLDGTCKKRPQDSQCALDNQKLNVLQ